MKKRVIVLVSVCLVILIAAIVAEIIYGKSYFNEIKYDKVIEKIDNKESFVLVVTRTTCSHCEDFKPKMEKVANKYKVNVYYIEIDLLKDDELEKLNKYFIIKDTPTTIFFKDGTEKTVATRLVGDTSSEKIINKMKSNGFID